MTSHINPAMPVAGTPTTQSVRDNFATAASEISALQVAVGAPPPSSLISTGGATTIAAGVGRAYVATSAAVTLILPPNDCVVADRTGSRSNPITVTPPAGGSINGQSSYVLVNPWQVASFFWDGTGYAVA